MIQKVIVYHWVHGEYDYPKQCTEAMQKTKQWMHEDTKLWVIFCKEYKIYKSNLPIEQASKAIDVCDDLRPGKERLIEISESGYLWPPAVK